jgi:hypothetical protein
MEDTEEQESEVESMGRCCMSVGKEIGKAMNTDSISSRFGWVSTAAIKSWAVRYPLRWTSRSWKRTRQVACYHQRSRLGHSGGGGGEETCATLTEGAPPPPRNLLVTDRVGDTLQDHSNQNIERGVSSQAGGRVR